MDLYTVNIDLPGTKLGDKWLGISAIGPVVVTGLAQGDLTRVRMHFKHQSGARFRLDSDAGTDPDAPIIIDNAVDWSVHVPPVIAFLSLPGNWSWDMEFFQDGEAAGLTLYQGVLVVARDVSSD